MGVSESSSEAGNDVIMHTPETQFLDFDCCHIDTVRLIAPSRNFEQDAVERAKTPVPLSTSSS